MYKRIITILLAGSLLFTAEAQNRSFAVNVADFINFLTINGEMSFTFTRHWSCHFRCRYNPFIFKEGSKEQLQNKKLELSAGVRFWSWNVNSGWFALLYPDYLKYNKFRRRVVWSPVRRWLCLYALKKNQSRDRC